MSKRVIAVIGLVLALGWAFLLVWVPQQVKLPFMPINVAMISAMVPPGLVIMLLIALQGSRRLRTDSLFDGQAYPEGTPGWINQRVLYNTIEQTVLALCLWPFVALTLGGGVVIALGFGFALGRLVYWLTFRLRSPLRAFGFGATFFPTAVATLWSLWVWAF